MFPNFEGILAMSVLCGITFATGPPMKLVGGFG